MPTLTRQPSFPFILPVQHYRPILVNINAASMVLEVPAESLLDWADMGELRNVFNISLGDQRRELRFDLAELLRRRAHLPETETEEAAVERIVGHPYETTLHTQTVARALQVWRSTVHYWLRAGKLKGPPLEGHRQMVYRASFVEFLTDCRV